jgi:hypothetical protein
VATDALAANVPYKVANATSGALAPSATAIEYPAQGNVFFAAYYPYEAVGSRVTADGKFNVSLADQSNPAAIDVLTAKTANVPATNTAPVALTFKHALVKITVNIKAGNGVTAAEVAAIAAGGVELVATPGSATIDLNGGSVAVGAVADIPLAKAATAASGYEATFEAIVAPSSGAGRTLSVEVDGRTVVWAIPANAPFESGYHYTYWGEVTENSFNVNSSSITPWTPNAKPDALSIDDKTENGRITWRDGRYALTTDPTDAGLYFKFGGVVGLYSANGAVGVLPVANNDPFDAPGDVAWSPVAVASWSDVPAYGTTDHPAPVDGAYHTAANVKAGKGDPCRLVGLDLDRIKNTAAAGLTAADIDNGIWRLPTNDENKAFTGYNTTSNSTADYWTALGGVNGAIFPNRTTGTAARYLPATGYRNNNTAGEVASQNGFGNYWSSTPYTTAGYGYCLSFFSDFLYSDNDDLYAAGRSVRCVRQ